MNLQQPTTAVGDEAGRAPATGPAEMLRIPREAAETTLQALFERQAERAGGRLAVHSGGRELTYGELNAASNRLAHDVLDRAGAGEHLAALLVDQGPPLVTAMLGSLKAGWAFAALDPAYPEARLRAMLRDSRAEMLISNDRHFELALRVAGDLPVLNVDHLSRAAGREGNPGLDVAPTRLACIVFTSGSTGAPKGVMQDHRSVVHNMLRYRAVFGLGEDDRQTLLYPGSVYASIRDSFNALLNGGRLYHYPIHTAGHLGLAAWLERHRITIYCSVATVFRYFARDLVGRDLLPHLRVVRLGGEAVQRRDVELFTAHFCAHAQLVCGLGSTETGMSRYYRVGRDSPRAPADVPLGSAVPDMDVLLLDEQRRPVAPGAIGQIAVRSRYVMLGYRGREELNARVLLPDPQDPQSRTFLTGDLGQLDARGCLVHRGRLDEQVKIRGNRVELPEIERALAECPGIRDAVVVARVNDRGDAQLVAYTVAAESPGPTVPELRARLVERLPFFMVPNVFVRIDAIPMTPNGKIDRRALPEPDERSTGTGREFELPETELERALLAIMKRLLKRERVGVTDSFFDLGGDSLLAVQVVLAIERELDRHLPLAAFYSAPSVRDLAARLTGGEPADPTRHEVVLLRGGGDKPPLFCLPGRGGTVFSYRGMVELLDRDRPVYGLQFPGLSGRDAPIADVPLLAAELLRRARTVQPEGPYLLLGYSFGGLVAYEMASQLRSAGEDVSYLGLVDSPAPNSVRLLPAHRRLAVHLRRFLSADAEGRRNYLSLGIARALRRLVGGRPATALHAERLPPGDGRVNAALQRMHDAAREARARYEPRPCYGRLHLFKTSSRPQWRDFYHEDATYGWSPHVPSGIAIHDIPGEHLEVFDPAHVAELAERVSASLASAGTG